MDNEPTQDEGLRVKLTRSLHYFDTEESYDVFIPAGTDGRVHRVTKDYVTVLFSLALVGPEHRKPNGLHTIEEEWMCEVNASDLQVNV